MDSNKKQTLVQALCGASSHAIAKSPAGCLVSVRLTPEFHLQEFYDIAGAPRFRHGRQLFYSHRRYDAVLFVYDLTDPSTRSSISCVWVPEVMTHLGDVGAIESGGRLDDDDTHVKSTGVINEFKFLWRQTFFSHSNVSTWQALKEGFSLTWRLMRLLLNESGIWTDSSIDRQAENLYLGTSLVPTAIIGMKADLIDRDEILDDGNEQDTVARGTPHLRLHANNAAYDSNLKTFLRKVGESVKRRSPAPNQGLSRRSNSRHAMLGFA